MILHLTGSGLKTQNTVGVSSGSRTVCNSDNYDFDGSRSIAALQGSTEYYDANDGCRDRSYISSRQSIQSDLNMVVSPNPSFGVINVDFGTEANGRISVINTNGVQVFSQKVVDLSIYNLNIETSGLYIIKFIHENGEVINKKAIIIN